MKFDETKKIHTVLFVLSLIAFGMGFVFNLFRPTIATAANVADRLAGQILLQVESKGEAWYVHPETKQRQYLGKPRDAFDLMRSQGLGISNADLAKIPVGSLGEGSTPPSRTESVLIKRLLGKILLQVEDRGEAWYVSPKDGKRYFLGRPEDAFQVMRKLGLGITNADLIKIPTRGSQPPISDAQTSCVVAGCSGQVCTDMTKEISTTCEFKPEYACYQTAKCERQKDGACGWSLTPGLVSCLASKGNVQNVTIALSGHDFAFSQNEIRVKKGARVTVQFTSEDGFHDWVVDEFNAATARVTTGNSTSATFTADQVGTFEYYCSVGNHRAMGMKGKLVVEE